MKLVCAFIVGLTISHLSGCGSGPKVTVYLSDPAQGGMQYYNELNGQRGFVKYDVTDKFVCFTQTDASAILNYCEGKK